jgi:hypothetical protein
MRDEGGQIPVVHGFKTKISKINVLPSSVHDKIRSDQQTEKTGLAHEPKRRTPREPRSPRGSGTNKVIHSAAASTRNPCEIQVSCLFRDGFQGLPGAVDDAMLPVRHKIAFPDAQHTPSVVSERASHAPISGDVLGEFAQPEPQLIHPSFAGRVSRRAFDSDRGRGRCGRRCRTRAQRRRQTRRRRTSETRSRRSQSTL